VTTVIIRKSGRLKGEVSAPPSKAYTHRTMIAALLSKGSSTISNPLISDDTLATMSAIKAYGAQIETQKNRFIVKGAESLQTPKSPIDCGESGATLRFMIPLAALACSQSTFLSALPPSRPISPLLQSLERLGVKCSVRSGRRGSKIKVPGGGIKGGKTSIRGDITSQFLSGLLFACPKAKMDTEIAVTTNLESKSYVQMTIEVLRRHGIRISASSNLRSLEIPSNQEYKPFDHEIEGDFSSAAFLVAAAAITFSKVKVRNIAKHSTDGNKVIIDLARKMGSNVGIEKNTMTIQGEQLNAVDFDAMDTPDLVPVVAVLACYSNGTSRIYNATRLRYKESDRLASLHAELEKMGGRIILRKDGLIIRGPCEMHGAKIDSHNDHRIAMACAVAGLGATGETEIENSECVSKSYPLFFDDLKSLGGDIVGG
jgi:3-phosphoshikimate 1-carboxyvinyltransferase